MKWYQVVLETNDPQYSQLRRVRALSKSFAILNVLILEGAIFCSYCGFRKVTAKLDE